jgi:peptidoglycan/xylan/chitin deacetylase (PgdA/CDA1 family)
LILSSDRLVESITSALLRHKANATFFISGVTATRNPKKVRRLYENGFEIASHGYEHVDYNRISDPLLDLKKSIQALAKLGIEPIGFRPPYLLGNEQQKGFNRHFGKTIHKMASELGIKYVSSCLATNRYLRLPKLDGAIEIPIDFEVPLHVVGPSGLRDQVFQTSAAIFSNVHEGIVFSIHPFLVAHKEIARLLVELLKKPDIKCISVKDYLQGKKGVMLTFDVVAFTRKEMLLRLVSAR